YEVVLAGFGKVGPHILDQRSLSACVPLDEFSRPLVDAHETLILIEQTVGIHGTSMPDHRRMENRRMDNRGVGR
ncbi:MAG: hypothetical protein ACOCWU_06705, partial [Spirochaetota bacterium]